MAVKKEDLKEITEYIKKHLSEWISGESLSSPQQVYEIELRERYGKSGRRVKESA